MPINFAKGMKNQKKKKTEEEPEPQSNTVILTYKEGSRFSSIFFSSSATASKKLSFQHEKLAVVEMAKN